MPVKYVGNILNDIVAQARPEITPSATIRPQEGAESRAFEPPVSVFAEDFEFPPSVQLFSQFCSLTHV